MYGESASTSMQPPTYVRLPHQDMVSHPLVPIQSGSFHFVPHGRIDERAGESPQIPKLLEFLRVLSLTQSWSSRERRPSGMIFLGDGPGPRPGLNNVESDMDSITQTTATARIERVACDGLVFPVLVWGRPRARPVLLLHGFPQEPLTWSAVAEALSGDGLCALAPFQRGYAASARPETAASYSYRQFVDDVIAIADALGLSRFDLVGFGVGAVQAWMAAARHPARVRSLTAIRFPHPAAFAEALRSNAEQSRKWAQVQQDLGAGNPEQKAAAMLAGDGAGLRRFLSASGLPEPFLHRYVSRLSEAGALAGALSWNQAISLEEFSRVPAVTVPTLLLWSEGPALGRAAAEASRSYVRASFTDVSIQERHHFLLETCPAAVIEPLRQHLRAT